jgi:hypothetical protein
MSPKLGPVAISLAFCLDIKSCANYTRHFIILHLRNSVNFSVLNVLLFLRAINCRVLPFLQSIFQIVFLFLRKSCNGSVVFCMFLKLVVVVRPSFVKPNRKMKLSAGKRSELLWRCPLPIRSNRAGNFAFKFGKTGL